MGRDVVERRLSRDPHVREVGEPSRAEGEGHGVRYRGRFRAVRVGVRAHRRKKRVAEEEKPILVVAAQGPLDNQTC